MSGREEEMDPARVYDRAALFYDFMQAPMEHMGGTDRRRRVLSRASGRTLEVGIGTGLNLRYYPEGVDLVGADISKNMLERARERSRHRLPKIALEVADVEALPHPVGSFQTVTGTCVFCSVADPVQGLREVLRVLKPSGRLLLLEHVRPRNPLLGRLFDFLSPLTRRLFGPEINRRTEDNLRAAGFEIADVRRDGIWREIEARPSPRTGGEDAG